MITQQKFDAYKGQEITAYKLSDKIEVIVCNFGATILSIKAPDSNGNKVDVVLNMTNVADMIEKGDYMGAVVGRCGNRIEDGRFTLNDVTYQLAKNDHGFAHLHGGDVGFDKRVFKATVEENSVLMEYVSPDGEEGYPGALKFAVRYTVKGSSLAIDYYGECDKDTVFNPTNHTYFNLNGEDDGSMLDNVLQIRADSYLEVNKHLIPYKKSPVAGTPFDFNEPKAIGEDIDEDFEQLLIAGGYDHNYCLSDYNAATVYSPTTGICMDVFTDCCGMQFYTGNFLEGQEGKSTYEANSGFCLETQYYPNAINSKDENVEKPILKKGEKFHSRTEYVFSVL